MPISACFQWSVLCQGINQIDSWGRMFKKKTKEIRTLINFQLENCLMSPECLYRFFKIIYTKYLFKRWNGDFKFFLQINGNWKQNRLSCVDERQDIAIYAEERWVFDLGVFRTGELCLVGSRYYTI